MLTFALPQPFVSSIMTARDGVGGDLHLLTLKLFVNNPVITRNNVVADFTEPTFDGYAPAPGLLWGADWIDVAGVTHRTANSEQFTCTGSTHLDDVVFGYFLTDAAGTVFHGAAYLPAPVPISFIGAAVFVEADTTYGG